MRLTLLAALSSLLCLTRTACAEPWFFAEIRGRFIDTAIKHRKPDVAAAEASTIASRIINAALAPPQVTPLARAISNAIIVDGNDIPPDKCLKFAQMATSAYSEIRQSPGFMNYLQYIKHNAQKFDFSQQKGTSSSSLSDKLESNLRKYDADPQGHEALMDAKSLGLQIAKDAQIPPDKLPSLLKPETQSNRNDAPRRNSRRPVPKHEQEPEPASEQEPGSEPEPMPEPETEQEPASNLSPTYSEPQYAPQTGYNEQTNALGPEYATTVVWTENPTTEFFTLPASPTTEFVTQTVVEENSVAIVSETLTFTADWMITTTVPYTLLETAHVTVTQNEVQTRTVDYLQTLTIDVTNTIKEFLTVYDVKPLTLTLYSNCKASALPTTVTYTVFEKATYSNKNAGDFEVSPTLESSLSTIESMNVRPSEPKPKKRVKRVRVKHKPHNSEEPHKTTESNELHEEDDRSDHDCQCTQQHDDVVQRKMERLAILAKQAQLNEEDGITPTSPLSFNDFEQQNDE